MIRLLTFAITSLKTIHMVILLVVLLGYGVHQKTETACLDALLVVF